MVLRTSELKTSINTLKNTFLLTLFIGSGALILFIHYSLKRTSKLENDIKTKEKTITDWALQWQDTFDSVKDMIMLFDKEGRLKAFNLACTEFFKETLLRDDFIDAILGIKPQFPISKIIKISDRWFDLRTYSMTDLSGSIVILRDITEQKETEERLKTTERLSSLGIMAGGIAHEINNPLTSVIGFTELLLMHETDERKKNYLTLILSSGNKIENIIKDLRIFKDLSDLKLEDIFIEDFLDRIIKDIEIEAKGIRIIKVFSGVGSAKINRGLFEIAINNLIKNALQAINDSGKGDKIEVRTLKEDGILKIEISDNGPGIPDEILPHIFEPFFTTKDVGKGMGLGLSIVYEIIKKHGGDISVKSIEGKETTFQIKLFT